jgi:hypothetical protein
MDEASANNNNQNGKLGLLQKTHLDLSKVAQPGALEHRKIRQEHRASCFQMAEQLYRHVRTFAAVANKSPNMVASASTTSRVARSCPSTWSSSAAEILKAQ